MKVELVTVFLVSLVTGIASAQRARPTPEYFGDGSDGDLVVTTTVDVNTDRRVLTTSFGPGPVTIQLPSPAFSVGDEVLVHQVQCSIEARAGQYDLAHVTAVAGNTVRLSPLGHAYLSGSWEVAAPGANVAQIVRVPHFHDVRVLAGGRIKPGAWAGEEGGIVVMRVSRMLRVEGEITVDGLGFLGGAGDNAGTNGDAHQGESYQGLGIQSVLPNDGGGGGGRTPGINDGAGGAGGGHLFAGADGIPHNASSIGGNGGLLYPPTLLWPGALLYGSGGGGGSIDRESDGGGNGHSGSGGRGGGIILIIARFVDVTGTISARGIKGSDAANSVAEHGGGGGGSGGTIVLYYDQGSIPAATIDVQGGAPGAPSGDVPPVGYGGMGSEGNKALIEL